MLKVKRRKETPASGENGQFAARIPGVQPERREATLGGKCYQEPARVWSSSSDHGERLDEPYGVTRPAGNRHPEMVPILLHPSIRLAAMRLAALAIAAIALTGVGCRDGRDGPPDIVVLLLDTLRPDHLEMLGYDVEVAPFLEELRERSTLFRRAYSTSSCTPPAVASLFTGVYPRRHGVFEVIYAPRAIRFRSKKLGVPYQDLSINTLPSNLDSLPELLKRAGYRTFGVSSNPNVGTRMGFDRGFDRFERVVGPAPGAEEVMAAVREIQPEFAGASPRFLYVHFMDPHYPYHKRDESTPIGSDDSYRNAPATEGYDREIRYMDRHLKELMHLLQLRERTIVVVVSDHGEELHDRGRFGHAFGLHAELNRALIMISAPFLQNTQRTVDLNVSLIDIMPTLMEAIGAPISGVDGISLWPLLDPESEERAALERQLDQRTLFAHRRQRVAGKPANEAWSAIRGPWRLIEDRRDGGGPSQWLYDHVHDGSERVDLSGQHPDRVQMLQEEINAYRALPAGVFEKKHIELTREEAAELQAMGYVEP